MSSAFLVGKHDSCRVAGLHATSAEGRVLQSGHWLTLDEVANLAGKCHSDAEALVLRWAAERRIFTISYDEVEYFPRYALDPGAELAPLPAIRYVVDAFGDQVAGWRLAFWFSSPNGYLDGKLPQAIVASNPDTVVLAALREAEGIQHG